MKRKKLVLLVSAIVLLGGYSAGIYANMTQPQNELTQKQIDNPNTESNQTDIAKSVLNSTGRSEQYDLNDLEEVVVYVGSEATNREDNAVVTLNFGPKNTVVAAYRSDGSVYEFTGDLGDFYGVENITFVPVEGLGKEVIIIQERINQSLGSFEQTDVMRGYVYDGNKYQSVLNTPQKIQSSWNDIWNKGLDNPSLWRRITEETENKWVGGKEPYFQVTRYQTYLESDNKDEMVEPEDDTFEQKKERVVVEQFYWSEEWQRFILKEAIEKETGQKVAIVENLQASAYQLAGFEDAEDYGIMRKDGSFDYVHKDDLEF